MEIIDEVPELSTGQRVNESADYGLLADTLGIVGSPGGWERFRHIDPVLLFVLPRLMIAPGRL